MNKAVMKFQSVTLVFTDKDDGSVDISVTFDPVVRPDDQVSPAVFMALQALKLAKAQQSPAPAGKESRDE